MGYLGRHQDDQQALRQMEEYIARCTREQQFASKQAEIQRRACLENIDVLYLQEENRKIANKLDNCIEENNTLRA